MNDSLVRALVARGVSQSSASALAEALNARGETELSLASFDPRLGNGDMLAIAETSGIRIDTTVAQWCLCGSCDPEEGAVRALFPDGSTLVYED